MPAAAQSDPGPWDEVMFLDATAQADLVRRGEITPRDLVQAAIDRIERLNPALNAVVTPMFEWALVAADNVDPAAPFAGVPFLMKDLGAMVAGVPLTGGSAATRDFVPQIDSTLYERFTAAGLITVGKSNTPELGLVPTTEPALFGPCRNPWAPDRSAGGSSGGAAAAVAAGLVPVAHASDGGGSIRIPASCCGLFGLKPTRARTPAGPIIGDWLNGLSISHVVSRSVRDSAALLDAIAGPAPGDPYWAPPPARPFAADVGADPGSLRIAYTTASPLGDPIDPAVVAAVEDAARLCADLGHHVFEQPLAVPADALTEAFLVLWRAGVAASVRNAAGMTGTPPDPGQYEPLTWRLYEQGERLAAADYLLAIQTLQGIGRAIGRLFTQIDLLLTPVVTAPPPPLGYFDNPPDEPERGFWRAVSYVPFTPLANATGQPAMSVPLSWTADGLPIGVHFIGRFGDEATLFQLAAQLEAARPWAGRRPRVHS